VSGSFARQVGALQVLYFQAFAIFRRRLSGCRVSAGKGLIEKKEKIQGDMRPRVPESTATDHV
jgi:hypothetical protein